MTMKKIGILYHPLKEATHALSKKLESFLVSRKLSVWVGSAWDWEQQQERVGDTDLIISVGGPGCHSDWYPDYRGEYGPVRLYD
jgi:hypothetical protein